VIYIKTRKVKITKDIRESIHDAVIETYRFTNSPSDAALTVLLTDDHYIRKLNFQYRGIDKPTDVLSFQNEEDFSGYDEKYLGDIIVSIPTAEVQSSEAGHPIKNELSLLVIHGVLHLLGYDHDSSENKRVMWALQEKVLSRLGIQMSHFSGDENA
jgi:probable rRNA maturation factor